MRPPATSGTPAAGCCGGRAGWRGPRGRQLKALKTALATVRGDLKESFPSAEPIKDGVLPLLETQAAELSGEGADPKQKEGVASLLAETARVIADGLGVWHK